MEKKMELLAPAGSPEAVVAAVQSGADAIYLGCGSFNARRNAANFTEEQLAQAVEYCHVRGTKVYLTLNTLLYDRELEPASALVRYADAVGVDALLVQDLGVLRMARETAPDLPIHASTQMTLHNLDGVKLAADLGVTRAVLSRELSKDQIGDLCAKSPIELEVFVHGALCMCYSGQCFFSSVIGGRSGNRGLCAQPCRLKYGWEGKANRELLSLKDLRLAEYLNDLQDMGVACAKIEGRMKRPEYVAVVTKIYASLLKEHRQPTQQELKDLEAAFSRQGFTQGYYNDRKGPAMFGVHKENQVDPTPMFQAAKATYSRGEAQRVPISIQAEVQREQPVLLSVRDQDGHQIALTGPVPEAARNRAMTRADVENQLKKTGGTPYVAAVSAQVGEGLSLPLSALNKLRREALDRLTEERAARPSHTQHPWHLPPKVMASPVGEPGVVVSVQRWDQVTDAILDLCPARIDIPLELVKEEKSLIQVVERCPVAVVLPRILWDRERAGAVRLLERAKALGVTQCLASTWGGVRLGQELGFAVIGDFGLGVTNSETLRGLGDLGLFAATLSFEQRLARLRDLSPELDTELIVYGRLPLMVMENCVIANRTGGKCVKACKTGENLLTDRKGAAFPVLRAYGCRNEILNSKPLYLADKRDYLLLGCSRVRLLFTTESPGACTAVFKEYLGLEPPAPGDFTRGLYYRDVE